MELQQIGPWTVAHQHGSGLAARYAEPVVSPNGAAVIGSMRSTVFIEPPDT
jgi:hypothetical protein